MKRRELKGQAQEMLMHAMCSAVYRALDDNTLSSTERDELISEIEAQYRRVEKLFGFVPGSWSLY